MYKNNNPSMLIFSLRWLDDGIQNIEEEAKDLFVHAAENEISEHAIGFFGK